MGDFQNLLSTVHFVNWVWVLLIPAALMAIDFGTGFLGAWVRHDIQSSKMRTGLGKKIGEVAVLVIGELFTAGMALPMEIMTGVSLYIVFMELVSIAENLAALGVPVPKKVKEKLKSVQDAVDAK